ncbi:MAG: hypothetical protein PHT25_00740 [Bacteroidales bacterium]|nr:hypothetical protein [Bacteroidales bacterium]
MNFTAVQIRKVMPYEKKIRISHYREGSGKRSGVRSCLPEASTAGGLEGAKQKHTSQQHQPCSVNITVFLEVASHS